MNGLKSSSTATAAPLLRIEDLSLGFGQTVVLRHLSFEVPARGTVGVMGPSAVGKSTLLKTLARLNQALPSFWYRGRVSLDGESLLDGLPLEVAQRQVPLLAQKARLFMSSVAENVISEIRPAEPLAPQSKRELAWRALAPLGLWEEFEGQLEQPVLSLSIGSHRRLGLARLVAGGARCLLADEPLRDLADDEAEAVAQLLERLRGRLAVVLVTHNLKEARRLCDRVALLVDGGFVEEAATEEFFDAPRTELARTFLRYGNCWPEPAARRVTEPVLPPPGPLRPTYVPSGFFWVKPGLLGGGQRPGLLRPLAEDLEALAQLGCKLLVSLTEEAVSPRELAAHGIEGKHVPIEDMGVPTVEVARALSGQVSDAIDQGLGTVLHCKAGLGRTGTMLACVLVYRGESAVGAIGRVRGVNPRYIQSDEQLSFVSAFAEVMAEEPRACSAG